MMETHQAASAVQKAAEFTGAEAVNNPGNGQIDHTHGIGRTMDPGLYIGWPVSPGIHVKLSRDEHRSLNKAEIRLLPGEAEKLTRALIGHPILLPTSYSQSSSLEGGKHSLRIASTEPFADFVERLSDALGVLKHRK